MWHWGGVNPRGERGRGAVECCSVMPDVQYSLEFSCDFFRGALGQPPFFERQVGPLGVILSHVPLSPSRAAPRATRRATTGSSGAHPTSPAARRPCEGTRPPGFSSSFNKLLCSKKVPGSRGLSLGSQSNKPQPRWFRK